jgi:ectoine hydroxylase-related dioxygenase (phytanoyl-CoA dioxygenase family)
VSFHDDGFALVADVFSADELDAVARAVDAIEARARTAPTREYAFERGSPGILRRTFRPLDLEPSLKMLLGHARLLDVIASCIGPDIEFVGSKIVWKPPRTTTTAPWHQDLAYYRHSNANLVTASLHLDDFSDGEGALRFARGSQRDGLRVHVDGYLAGDDVTRAETRAVDGAVARGGVTLHHSLTAHAARVNDTDRMRKRLLLMFRATDCVPLEAGLPFIHGDDAGTRVRGAAAAAPRYEQYTFQYIKVD